LSIGQGSPHLISIYILSMAIVAIICTCFMKRDQNLVFNKKYIQTEV